MVCTTVIICFDSFEASRGRAKTWILKLTSMGDYTKVAFRYPRIYEIELSVTSYLLAETMSLSIFRGTTLKLLKNLRYLPQLRDKYLGTIFVTSMMEAV